MWLKEKVAVMTPHGKCIEIVEQRAFEQALERAGDVSVTVDHNNSHFYASTSNNTRSEERRVGKECRL